MKLHGGIFLAPRELCSRMHVQVSTWTLRQMTSHLILLILSSLALSSQLGLDNVFFSPQDQTVREGEEVFFQCVSGESLPPARISWLKDGTPVTRGRQIQGEYGGGKQRKTSGTLHFSSVTLEDDGMYICVTHNSLLNISKRSKLAKLNVRGIPKRLQITQGPDNITVAQATEVSMHCTVHGFPVPMVHWFKDGCLLTNCSASFSLHNNGQLLIFRNVSKEDEGWYQCEASNQDESIKSHPAYLLPAEMDWSFVQHPTNVTVQRGENVTLTCRPPYSRPAAQVSWFKNNQLLTQTDHVTALPNGDLFFHSVLEYDGGSYFCRASNIYLQRFVTSRRATLTVQASPSVKIWPRVLTVPLGARAVLGCQASGHPLPSISWLKRGHSKQTGGKVAFGLSNASLYIESTRIYDEGVYVCVASNTLGQSRDAAMLKVAVSPIIVTFLGQVSSKVGVSVVLPCRAVGIEPITYTWTRGGTEKQSPISLTEDRRIDEDGALHISSLQQYDVGDYFCTAENRAGRHQRRTILTVADKYHPADRDKQTRPSLSAGTITSKEPSASQFSNSEAEPHHKTSLLPDIDQNKSTCSFPDCDAPYSAMSREAVDETPPGSIGRLLQHHLRELKPNPTQPLVSQMQPPMLPPPPHPKSVHLHTQLPVTSAPLLISNTEPTITHGQTEALTSQVVGTTVQYILTERQSRLISTSTPVQFQDEFSDKFLMGSNSHESNIYTLSSASEITESFTDAFVSQPKSKRPAAGPFAFLKSGSYSVAPTESLKTISGLDQSGSVTHSSSEWHQTESHQVLTKSHLYEPRHEPEPTHTDQTKLRYPEQAHSFQNGPSVTNTPKSQIHSQPMIPTTTSPLSQPQSLPTQHPHAPLPQTEMVPLHHSNRLITQSSISTIHPPDQTSKPSLTDPEINHQVQLNISVQGDPDKTTNDTELTEGMKWNTSQSPMTSNYPRVTQQSPSWLPLVEKHDIPIVVGVGVSLAFIFIAVFFYSVVQKNEPTPPSRAAQRNLGVPIRHAERRAAGRTYENRAFEDDDCVAVIEQSPNTSDTRARPPGPSLVTVQMEPTFLDLQGDTLTAPDDHSVTMETYPDPILDTKTDPSLEDCSLSQPSIHLQCAEDWSSQRGESHSPCQDAFPPPSSIPNCSPSHSPPSRIEEGLHSSLTLQSAEACTGPIHHSLSISPGNPPLLLSHHVSMGLTTVAVNVHFYPAATASAAVGTSTHINSLSNSTSLAAPLFSPPLVNSPDNHLHFK